MIKIHAYSHLSSNRGFLIYEPPSNEPLASRSRQISVISINFEDGFYEPVGNSYELLNFGISSHYSFFMTNPIFVIKFYCSRERRPVIHIFEINSASFIIKSHQKMSVPENSILFNSINGKLIFTRCIDRRNVYTFGNFTLIEKNNSFVEIANTSVRVEMQKLEHLAQV